MANYYEQHVQPVISNEDVKKIPLTEEEWYRIDSNDDLVNAFIDRGIYWPEDFMSGLKEVTGLTDSQIATKFLLERVEIKAHDKDKYHFPRTFTREQMNLLLGGLNGKNMISDLNVDSIAICAGLHARQVQQWYRLNTPNILLTRTIYVKIEKKASVKKSETIFNSSNRKATHQKPKAAQLHPYHPYSVYSPFVLPTMILPPSTHYSYSHGVPLPAYPLLPYHPMPSFPVPYGGVCLVPVPVPTVSMFPTPSPSPPQQVQFPTPSPQKVPEKHAQQLPEKKITVDLFHSMFLKKD